MTLDEALAKVDTRWWETASDREIVDFQLNEERLCMPFGEFQRAMESVLGRGVWTHEFANPQALRDEIDGKREPLDPIDSLAQIIGPSKVIVVVTDDAEA